MRPSVRIRPPRPALSRGKSRSVTFPWDFANRFRSLTFRDSSPEPESSVVIGDVAVESRAVVDGRGGGHVTTKSTGAAGRAQERRAVRSKIQPACLRRTKPGTAAALAALHAHRWEEQAALEPPNTAGVDSDSL